MTVKEENVENAAAVEGQESATEKQVAAPVIKLEILKVIKDAQQQHGLRHGDFQRYRGYCSRRIRRLRKVVHLPQGDRRHYKRKDVTADNVVDHRSLMIPLMMTERAWGYAMQLRQESNTEPRKKFHLIARLRKAAGHAIALEAVCAAANCDPRTKLEAQAYVAWIHGSLQFELQLWKTAIEHLKKAQVMYEKLSEVVPELDAAIYKHRVEELNPTIRYCAYNIGDGADEDLLALRTHGEFLANFDSLLEKRQAEATGSGGELDWRGHSLPLRPERVRMYVLADQQLDSALSRAKDDQDKLQLLEDNLLDCKDAISSLRDVIQADPAYKASRTVGSPLLPLQMLLTFLMHTRLSRTLQRNLLMAEQLRTSEKKTRPQDLARFYEMVLQNLQEMAALPGLEADAAYKKELDVKVSLYKAVRCFYIAEYLVTLKKWKEALALYERAGQHLGGAKGGDAALKAEWNRINADLEKSKFSALAHSVLDEGVTEDSATTKQYKSKKPLVDRLDEYKEEPALLTKTPGVVKLPPEMLPIPCKPLYFDLALNFVEFPSLDHKVEASKRQNQSGLTGLVKGFLGWGGSK